MILLAVKSNGFGRANGDFLLIFQSFSQFSYVRFDIVIVSPNVTHRADSLHPPRVHHKGDWIVQHPHFPRPEAHRYDLVAGFDHIISWPTDGSKVVDNESDHAKSPRGFFPTFMKSKKFLDMMV